jgi:butyrate kinase
MFVLVVNPGSTSTKIALYGAAGELRGISLSHEMRDLAGFAAVADQLDFRKALIVEALRREEWMHGQNPAAVVGRGGLLHPLEGGVYRVNEEMKQDLLRARYGSHASNLGALLADQLAAPYGVPAFIADPVVVDELSPLARYSGLPEIPRKSIFHALNQKATARKAAEALGRRYEECNLIVAHMGGGTSVGIHERGRVADVNNALDGDGPFAIERAGRLPPGDWLRFIIARQEDPALLQRRLTGCGGVVAHLQTNDARLIEQAIEAHLGGGPPVSGLDGAKCLEVMQAMSYQVAKEICSLAASVEGRVDAVVLTGGLAHSGWLVAEIRKRVSFLAPVLVFAGENEMEALAAAAFSALAGRVEVLEYQARP